MESGRDRALSESRVHVTVHILVQYRMVQKSVIGLMASLTLVSTVI